MDAYNSAPRDARATESPPRAITAIFEDLVWRRDNLFEEFRQSGYTVNRPGWWEMPTGTRISPWFGWWSLPAGGPIEPLAQTVIKAIRELGLPAIQREIERPLDPVGQYRPPIEADASRYCDSGQHDTAAINCPNIALDDRERRLECSRIGRQTSL